MRIETAEVSLIGERDSNQDRVGIVGDDDSCLAVVIDGMGGHAEGERAAELALQTLTTTFSNTPQPITDPGGFLRLAITDAHKALVALGAELPMHSRPRATVAMCLVQRGQANWAHVGDSRVYLMREGQILTRTRDHSHVEVLLREGLISEEDLHDHPLRNYVEFCLGGEPETPDMDVSPTRPLQDADTLLLCSDGFWNGLDEQALAAISDKTSRDDLSLEQYLRMLAESAVAACSPHSDNTTGAVLRLSAA